MRDNIQPSDISRYLFAARGEVREAVVASVERKYLKNLHVRTRMLLGTALSNFDVHLDYWYATGEVIFKAVWKKPGIKYFYRRLYGYFGPDSLGRTFGHGKDTEIHFFGQNYFIELDKGAQADIKDVLNRALTFPLLEKVRKQKKAEPSKPKKEFTRTIPGGWVEGLHFRREISVATGLSFEESKEIFSAIKGRGITVQQAIRLIKEGVLAQVGPARYN